MMVYTMYIQLSMYKHGYTWYIQTMYLIGVPDAVQSNSLPRQYHGDPPQCSEGTGEQPAQYPAQEQHKSIICGLYLYILSMYLVCTMYCFKINQSVANLWVDGMEALLWQIERIASCTHHILAQLRLPFHTAKCSQSRS
jgi:hypothetical protein